MSNINTDNDFNNKKEKFLKKNEYFRKPLTKIINKMLEDCRYINEESLERHNFGNTPIKLKNIPKNISKDIKSNIPQNIKLKISEENDDNLIEALQNNTDSSIIELLWGDIQLGKRNQACIIMWISVYIIKRPVLYVFRNLKIDQKQLENDIIETNKHNFNIQYIENIFSEFVNEDIEEDDWKQFALQKLQPTGPRVIDGLSNKTGMKPNDIFCCLMNHTQLEKINKKINEYICYNKELFNITLIVDESDLYSPTASNDNKSDKYAKDSTKCEKELSKMYKKVKYTLHITGTAHSLLYNITTKLTEDKSIQIPISKVHKMKRSENYYGLFNDKINFNTEKITSWWNTTDETTNKINTYTIGEDYNKNIKHVISHILNKSQKTYHSFLISEEKIIKNQAILTQKILNDFKNLFVIIFNGQNLELYLPKIHQEKIKYWSQQDSDDCKTGKRLYDDGGINGLSHESINDYCYFKINAKKFNIKQIYKILAMFFLEEPNINFRTVITITGRYGERGYSFTSDDYDKYQLHLTDQYFPCHTKNKNCTDISQRLRLQGKYGQVTELTLWTSDELKNIIQKFYIPFIKIIESDIMDCNGWEDTRKLIERIIDDGLV